MPGIVERVFGLLRVPSLAPLGPVLLFGLNLTALIVACSLSWHFFEKKINDLKRYFPYVRPAKEAIAYPQAEVESLVTSR